MSAPVTGFSTAARAAVREARSHLGYREGPKSNQNIFGQEYGWDRVAWCVQFAWYCGHVTGSDGGIPKTASTGAAMRWAKAVGRWHETPQPGDWSIMVNSKGATIHTDLVESYEDGRLICIGGNTSGSYGGSVHEGNGVYRNDRTAKWKAGRILGFVRPLYGVSREAVELVQRTDGQVKVDGKYGPATRAAVIRVQKRLGLTADGFPGPKTVAALTGEEIAETIPPAVDDILEGVFDDVDVTQQRLNSLGYGPLEVDGKYGPKTAAATRQYQTDMGITADGRPGPATRTHMEDTMAKIDDILTELKRVRPDIATVHNSVNDTPRRVINYAVNRSGGQAGKTNLGAFLAWNDSHVVAILDAIKDAGAAAGVSPEAIAQITDAVSKVGAQDVAEQLEVSVKDA